MNEHLVFYDADCGFCYRFVVNLLAMDRKKQLLFAPLNGETAKEILIGPNAHYALADSVILVENFRSDRREFWMRSQAAFRIYWLIDSRWIGWLSFLPSGFCDGIYSWIAKHRHRLNVGWKRTEFQNDRFLP